MINELNTFFDKLGIYAWVLLVGLTGALLNAGNRQNKSTKRKVGDFIVGLISSCFFGWIGFEVIRFIYRDAQIAIAGCGFFAWKGTVWVEAIVEKALNKFIDSKPKGGWSADRYGDDEYN